MYSSNRGLCMILSETPRSQTCTYIFIFLLKQTGFDYTVQPAPRRVLPWYSLPRDEQSQGFRRSVAVSYPVALHFRKLSYELKQMVWKAGAILTDAQVVQYQIRCIF